MPSPFWYLLGEGDHFLLDLDHHGDDLVVEAAGLLGGLGLLLGGGGEGVLLLAGDAPDVVDVLGGGPAFQMAVDDDLIRKNPFEFQLATVVVNDSVTREAITRKQERAFLEFVANDKHFCRYYEGIFILFKTGLRISEFVGLTLSDLDMQNRKISVNHQLQRKRNMEYVIEDTKTSCGTREIPMTDEVYKCFQRIISSRKKPRVEPIVGGKCGFLYLDKNDMPMVALHWEKYFQHICEKYNSIYRVQMPKVTPHVCRHTFCSNMAKSGMNPKTLQYLMGHSDISVTLNTYTHIGYDDAKEELKRVVNGE